MMWLYTYQVVNKVDEINTFAI